MFNLLNMDLYRVKRSKSVYVCLCIFFAITVLVYWMLWLLATPGGQEKAVSIGLILAEERESAADVLSGVDSLVMFRQICQDGGMYKVVFGIWVMLFVCSDFQGGFIKNIMALHQKRQNYIGSKIITAGIVNFCFLVLNLIFTLMMNRLFGNMVPYAGWKDLLFYLSWDWLLMTAFGALIILVCILTRSVAAGAAVSVLLGSGMIVMMLYGMLNVFHMGGWMKYTIYLTGSMGPGRYTSMKDLYVYVVGAGFLVLYTVAAGIALKRQDI